MKKLTSWFLAFLMIVSINSISFAVDGSINDNNDFDLSSSHLPDYITDMFQGHLGEYTVYDKDNNDITEQYYEIGQEFIASQNWNDLYHYTLDHISYITRTRDSIIPETQTYSTTQTIHKTCQFYVLVASTNPPGYSKELVFTLEGDYVYNTQFDIIQEADTNSMFISGWIADWGSYFNPAFYYDEEFYSSITDDGKVAVMGVRFWLEAGGNGVQFGQIDRAFTISV